MTDKTNKINLVVFETLGKRCDLNQLPFLASLRKKAEEKKPYQGLDILINTPLTMITVFQIETLILGGANITANCCAAIPPQAEALEILKAANVEVKANGGFDERYDFHLDCCGEFLDKEPPKQGAIELTQTGAQLYKNAKIDYPVISITDSPIKSLETFLGTGDGFTRALYQIAQKNMYNKLFVIFGSGKVGTGIVYALKKYTNLVTVIAINKPVSPSVVYQDIQFISASDTDSIKKIIQSAYCVVTATGIKHILSNYYNLHKENFGDALLANMGAEDEYGENFSSADILFEKKPLNFSLKEPTQMKYLDPILYAHTIGIDLILSKKFSKNYSSFPHDLALDIIQKWQAIHKEDVLIFAPSAS